MSGPDEGLSEAIADPTGNEGADIPADMAGHETDTVRTSRPGYPRPLPLGNEIRWEVCDNQTEIITIVAGEAPVSPDHFLHILDELHQDGLDDSWFMDRLEVNVDGRKLTLEGTCYTLQHVRGWLLKLYQKRADLVRAEAVFTERIPHAEAFDFLEDLAARWSSRETQREMVKLQAEISQVKKVARTAYQVAVGTRDRRKRRRRS
jgi:hypothetical protein